MQHLLQKHIVRATIYPKTHYVTPREKILEAIEKIKAELKERRAQLLSPFTPVYQAIEPGPSTPEPQHRYQVDKGEVVDE